MNARIFAFACLVLVPFAAGAQAEEHWTFSVTPYIWLPNVNGTLKYNPPPSGGAPEVDTGPNNYLENLSFALMLSGETAVGKNPVLVVETMRRIVCAAEESAAVWGAVPTPPRLNLFAN